MRHLDRPALQGFVSNEIVRFHQRRLARLEELSLTEVLGKKNPYLFRAKNLVTAGTLISAIMDAFLSSSEEKLFGDFLEELAIFVAWQTCAGRKSSAQGIDLEFDQDNIRYLVSIKSGPNWGKSSQYRRLEDDFKRATTVQRQAHATLEVRSILGICYGKTATPEPGVYSKIVGQSFWHFLSGDPNLYIDIIEPIGHQAKQHNDDFRARRAAIENRFTAEFIERFCSSDFSID